MGYVSLQIKPGINVTATPLLNEGGWSTGSGIRFFQGLVQKGGGWLQMTSTTVVGVARGSHAWGDLVGNPYMAFGSEQRLALFTGGAVYDITPLRQVTNPAVSFSTTSTSTSVKITDPGHAASVGDWINIIVVVAVGGLLLSGFYQIATIVDANNYTVTAASPATATVVNGGAVPAYTTINANPNLKVTLANHGLTVGNTYMAAVSTVVDGFTIAGSYTVTSVIDANNFNVQPGGNATSGVGPIFENGGNTQIQYLVPTGQVSTNTSPSSSGYGVGLYGTGLYGSSGTVITPLRQWFLDHFGQDLIGNYTGSPIFVWAPPYASGNVALAINTTNFPGALGPPTQVNVSFMSAPQQMLIALGCDILGQFNPLLVRWCDAGDFTDWTASSTNQAGSFAIASGSRLVGGLSAPNFVVIWTDVDMWLMSYLGGSGLSTLVWGFNKVTGSSGLLSARSAGLLGSVVYYASPNGFFRFDGIRNTPIQCPVWDKFWDNLNEFQADKVNCQVNSLFREISWCFPSASGNGECDQRITLNVDTGTWTYDDQALWARTTWLDKNVYGAPVGVDLNNLIVQHEVSNDANGQPLSVFVQSGWFSVSEGTMLTMMERMVSDLHVEGGNKRVFITVQAQDDPDDPNIRTYGPYPWALGSGPPYQIVRARGRFMNVQISSSDAGVFWRIGRMRYLTQQAGRRP